MSPWLWSAVGLIPPLGVGLWTMSHGSVANRLVALQLTSALTIVLLAALTFTFDQASSIDLALTLTFLTLPGTLVFALFTERWL
jgi:multisubunit Na+/H+ antiporter MnhF subunit